MNRSLAHIISVLAHPLLVLTYAFVLMTLINPYAFGVRSLGEPAAIRLLLSIVATTFFLPGFGVAMLRPLGFVKSMQMHDKQERTGAYIITGVFYLWMFRNLYGNGIVPPLYATFVLGATIGLFMAFFLNIFSKISAHATGMGGLVAMMLITAFEWPDAGLGLPVGGGVLGLSMVALLAVVVMVAGLVGMARLALNAHIPSDLYRGYAAGMVSVFLASLLMSRA